MCKKRLIITILTLFVLLWASPLVQAASKTLMLDITGVADAPLQNVKARLAVIQKSLGDAPAEDEVRAFIEKAPDNINKALEPYGYFKSTTTTQLTQTAKGWVAHFKITPGPLLPVTKVNVKITGSGQSLPEFKVLLANFPIKEGDTFTTADYENAKDTFFDTAHALGYMHARVTKEKVLVDINDYQAKVILHFDTGPRFYFGEVTFLNSTYAPSFLHKFVPFKTGDPYSPAQLQTFQSNLTGTKYFSSITVLPDLQSSKNEHIPVTVQVKDPPKREYHLGLGYGTNTGARTSIGASINRITDTGQYMDVVANLSEVTTGVSAKYYIPGPEPALNQYTLGVTAQTFDPDNGDAFVTEFSTGYETALSPMWHAVFDMNAHYENFKVSDDDPYRRVTLFYPDVKLTRLSVDDPVAPTKGSRVTLLARAGGFTQTNFAQGKLDGEWLYPVTKNNFLILRGSVGALTATDYDDFPLSLRFFAGGMNSVRGYGYLDLGPGKYLKTASIELQQRLHGSVYGAVFFDAGNASDDIDAPWERGIGVGIVWRSPVGPIAAYVAQANSKSDKPLSFEISVGAGL